MEIEKVEIEPGTRRLAERWTFELEDAIKSWEPVPPRWESIKCWYRAAKRALITERATTFDNLIYDIKLNYINECQNHSIAETLDACLTAEMDEEMVQRMLESAFLSPDFENLNDELGRKSQSI